MKGFKKEDEYFMVQAFTADGRDYAEMYDTEWTERECTKHFLRELELEDEYIVEVRISRVKRYTTKLHEF